MTEPLDLDALQAVCDLMDDPTDAQYMEFSRAARTAMPQLIARIRELEDKVENRDELIDWLCDRGDSSRN